MISVYMPVYNGEKYIRKSIESVLNQTYQDFELILIDDGSKDGSADICNEYRQSYPDKIVFLKNEKNIGTAETLNRGMKTAKGDYIISIADDDWIDEDTLAEGAKAIERTNADVLWLNRKGDLDGREIPYPLINSDFLGVMTDEKRRKLLVNFVEPYKFVFMGFLKREFIEKNQLYYEDISPEDIPFLPIVLMKAKKIEVVEGVYYHYRIHDDSIAHQINSPIYLKIHKAAELMIQNAKKYGCYDVYKKEWEYAFIVAFYYDSLFNQMARFEIRNLELLHYLSTYIKQSVGDYQSNEYLKSSFKGWQKELMRENDLNSEKLVEKFPDCHRFLEYVRNGEIQTLLKTED